jgi:hypothetical protein
LDAIDEHHSRCTLSQGDRFPAVAIPCLAAPPSPLVDALSKLIERDRILDRPIDRLTGKLAGIAKVCSDQVLVPADASCCGFAGDRGFLFPELTASATRSEAAEVKRARHDGYFSSSRTCEIGMTRATGEIYRSYLFLLEESTRS